MPLMGSGADGQVRKKILIIEDDAPLAKFLSYRLKKMRFDVRVAQDGEEGLNDARQTSPDLIILDLRLPKLPGEEVCKAIREDPNKRFARTPIIMVTAKDSDTDRVIGKVIGANRYVAKPFEADELLRSIDQLCSKHSATGPTA